MCIAVQSQNAIGVSSLGNERMARCSSVPDQLSGLYVDRSASDATSLTLKWDLPVLHGAIPAGFYLK